VGYGEEKMNRRDWLLGTLATMPLQAQKNRSLYAYVGCYTTEQRHGRGDGIHVYRVDSATGVWSPAQQVGNLVNPSFLVASRDGRFLYSVHGDESYATAFAIDPQTGNLHVLNQASTGGRNGVHQAFDPSGRFMVVANYATGTVAVMPVRGDGALEDQVQLSALEGDPGPHKVEQTGSHPHHVVFDPSGRFVIVPDKGLDRVFVFRFDASSGRLTRSGSVVARPGSGPRHAAFHPRLAVVWVLNELNSTVTTYRFDPEHGSLTPVQILPSVPEEFTGNNTGAEIAASVDGRFVYCSNRGQDSISVYAADLKTGWLKAIQWVPTGGHQPRFFCLDASHRRLYAANEMSDSIIAFRVNQTTGTLASTGETLQNASPATIAFAG
jgi:6-phosphogluconolactonase